MLLLDAQGRRVADSGARPIRSGEIATFAVAGDRLPAGEPGTGRLQLRAVVLMGSDNALPVDPCRASVEIVDEAGRTAVWVPPPAPEFSAAVRGDSTGS
jgi:hypothetical protein